MKISFGIAAHRENYYVKLKSQLETIGAQDIQIITQATSILDAYQQIAQHAKHDIVCFLHEDIELIQFDEKLIHLYFSRNNTGFLGVAGTRYLDEKLTWWQSPTEYLSGCCGHIQPNGQQQINFYGPFSQVVVLDGVLLITSKAVLQTTQAFEAPDLIGFDFYDISATLKAHLTGFKNYTIPMNLYHHGLGQTRPQWEINRNIISKRYLPQFPFQI